MRISLPSVIALCVLTFCNLALADDDVPDLGPPLRNFNPDKDCDCVTSSIARKQKILEGYRELAESYRDTLKDLGNGRRSPAWVDPNILSNAQRARLVALNRKFDEEEDKFAKNAPEADCGFPPGKSIVLVTDSYTGSPPSREKQRELKRLFPFEGLYDAVMLHEYHHDAEHSKNNSGRNAPAGGLPRARTPYGRALEEVRGYEIEIAALEKLNKKCKKGRSFKGVSFVARYPGGLTVTETLAGKTCGDPVKSDWRISQAFISRGIPGATDNPASQWETDCLAAGSPEVAARVNILRTSPQGGGWMCIYSPGPPETITISLYAKPGMGYSPLEQSKTVPVTVGSCN